MDSFAICEVAAAPLQCQPIREFSVHYVVKGRGLLESARRLIPLAPGTIIVLPRFTGATIASAASEGAIQAAGDPAWAEWMGKLPALDSGADLILACSTIGATLDGGVDLFEQLAQPLAEAPDNAKTLRSILKIVIEELAQPALGSRMVIEAMVKQSLVLLLRTHLKRLGSASPLFLPLQDPKLKGCIQAIIERPHAAHSVSSLAKLAGMSETRFNAHFTGSYGKTPMKFVQAVRLRDAADLLRTSDLPLKAIAARVGYSSRSHLSRLFQTTFGTDPTTYRAENRQMAQIF